MFYNFNAHKTSPESSGKLKRAAQSIISRITSMQRRWVMFTDINKGGFAKILLKLTLANLGCACVLFCLVVLIIYQQPTRVLPVYDRISIPMLPDQFAQQEDLQHQADFELYLDSLEKAFRTDSINDTRTINN
ncbi:MAG: hypothetical protein BGO21_14930 [Dyadobacter sp. 50-39]|uniref:hypothetical protein n=1 Tax=Dyadobacter sp. 50-39 TaxID=1895756 RepID=UPI00096445E8|nr:hypothetical protein [Dyadobacter sp. 50-39]OJV13225.1 MAG: hypothetical protein BGO21_14930 [Dyadobacter sp. 50-39]